MLIKSQDTRFLDWKVNNTTIHLEELKKRLPWQQFKTTKRMVCSLGKSYPYSGHITVGHSFELYPQLEVLMHKLNKELGTNYNSVLLNWYPEGAYVGIGKHSDNERELVSGSVASVSLGATCNFVLETWDKTESFSVDLKDGDVFIMGKECQSHYGHFIPYSKMTSDRISLTFREFK